MASREGCRQRPKEAGAGKVKLMCSFGGRIALLKHGDAALRYVRGQTRLISLPRAASFRELLRKLEAVVDAAAGAGAGLLVVKYQLPGEGLDSLVSVSGPEDYDNMMEEYERLAAAAPHGSARLRVFLFRASGSASCPGSSRSSRLAAAADGSGQKRYTDATNCVSAEAMRRKNSAGSSAAHSSELASLPPPALPSEYSYSGGASYRGASPEPVSSSAVTGTAPAMDMPAQNPIFVGTEPPAQQHQQAAAASYATQLRPQVASYLQQMPQSYIEPQQVQYVNAQQFTVDFVPVQMSQFVPSVLVTTIRPVSAEPVLERMHFTRFRLCSLIVS